MEFTNLRFADVVVAVPVGRLDHANAEALQRKLAPLLDNLAPGNSALLLDFSGVDYISSMGLRVLMIAAKQARLQHTTIGVAAMQPIVNEIFEISRFNHVLDVYPSVRAALQKLSAAALAAYDSDETPEAS